MENNKVIKEFKNLKNQIYPRPEWVALSRDILLQQISHAAKTPENFHQPKAMDYVVAAAQIFRQSFFQPVVVMLFVFVSILSSSLMINAAFYSLPGEPLYRVKLALEETHLALTPGEEQKVELKIEFAQKRMAELDKVVAQADITPEEKKKKIEVLVREFKNNVSSVSDRLAKINESNKQSVNAAQKELTLKMAVTVEQKAQDLAKSIDEKTSGLEQENIEVKQIVAEAVETAQATSVSAQEIIDEAKAETEIKIEGQVQGVSTPDSEAGDSAGDVATSSDNGTETTQEFVN